MVTGLTVISKCSNGFKCIQVLRFDFTAANMAKHKHTRIHFQGQFMSNLKPVACILIPQKTGSETKACFQNGTNTLVV